MKIEITIPDESVDVVADKIKRLARQHNPSHKQDPDMESGDLIKASLQGIVDKIIINSDPELIAAVQAAKAAKQKAEDKLKRFNND